MSLANCFTVKYGYGFLGKDIGGMEQQCDIDDSSSAYDDDDEQSTRSSSTTESIAMDLNTAYESLEGMRKLNLEVACQERGVTMQCEEQCYTCLLGENNLSNKMKWITKMHKPKKCPPCLVCGNHVCKRHSSKEFRRESITMCDECERIVNLDAIHDILTTKSTEKRQQHMDKMVDLYDRAVILLQYSSLYCINDLCSSLQLSKVTQNRVGLGSGAGGVVSGILGMASAAAIFTPVGPPLLVASLIFGGGSSVVQTGSDLRANYSEPSVTADRILALHGICSSILHVVDTIRDALKHDDNWQVDLDDKTIFSCDALKKKSPRAKIVPGYVKGASNTANAVGLVAADANRIGRLYEAGIVVRGARIFGRSTRMAVKAMHFARLAGGPLAATALILEAKHVSSTLMDIRAGDPCLKAQRLKRIPEEVRKLPRTHTMQNQCNDFLKKIHYRQTVLRRINTQDEVSQLLAKHSEILKRARELAASRYEQDETESTMDDDLSIRSTISLRERVEWHKSRDDIFSNLPTDSCCIQGDAHDRTKDKDFVMVGSNLFGDECASLCEPESLSSCCSTTTKSSLRERIEMHKKRNSMPF